MRPGMLTEKLLNAASTVEVLRVRYFGGSALGVESQLRPIAFADGKVVFCACSQVRPKSFVIAKLEEVFTGVPSAMAASIPVAATTFPSVDEFVAWHRHEFEAQGWVGQHEAQAVSLHRHARTAS